MVDLTPQHVGDINHLFAECCTHTDYEVAVVVSTTNFVTGTSAFAVDRKGVIVLWNPEAEHMFGYSASHALGRHCWNLLSGHDTYGNPYCSEHCLLRNIAFQSKPVNGFSVIYKTASDKWKLCGVSCLFVFNEPGNQLLMHICHPGEIEESNHGGTHTPASFLIDNKSLSLTPRECELLTILENGNDTREIALMLNISVQTVRNHIQHILKKLHVHNRLDAVLLGKRLELI